MDCKCLEGRKSVVAHVVCFSRPGLALSPRPGLRAPLCCCGWGRGSPFGALGYEHPSPEPPELLGSEIKPGSVPGFPKENGLNSELISGRRASCPFVFGTWLLLGQLELLLGCGSPWSLNSTCLLGVPRKRRSFLPRFDAVFPNQIQDLPNARSHKQQVLFFLSLHRCSRFSYLIQSHQDLRCWFFPIQLHCCFCYHLGFSFKVTSDSEEMVSLGGFCICWKCFFFLNSE